jgi:hypothetical protein
MRTGSQRKSRALYLFPAIVLASYALLKWFHSSWDTGIPVLDLLTPLVTAAALIGKQCKLLLEQPRFGALVLAAALLAGFAGLV